MILTIRTDKPEAEIGLFNGHKKIEYLAWEANRNLSIDIHKKIEKILGGSNKDFADVSGVAFYTGPGSFTGLRIGATVANTVADALGVPIIGKGGDDWIRTAIAEILSGNSDKIVVPDYGSPAKTTKPKK